MSRVSDLRTSLAVIGSHGAWVRLSCTMPRLRLMPLTLGVALCLLYPSCRQNANLRERIISADASKYCLPDACFNPHVLAVETGYDVTSFLGSKPQHAHVPTKNLAKYLQSLPMQAWPRGPSISVSPTDDVTDQHSVEQNFLAAQQVCRSMELQVQVLPGG
jgi:hypothetical protein